MTDNAIAIIPARGGSERIPRKNIRTFCGKPIIHWPLQAARESGLFSRVVVSTDDEEIAKIAREGGAEIPFMREATLADGITGVAEVVRDAVIRLDLPPQTPVCCFYATSPFITPEDLRAGYAALRSGTEPNWVLTLAPYLAPVRRAFEMIEGRLVPIHSDGISTPSQNFPPAYYDAGQFWWANGETWKNCRDLPIWENSAHIIVDPLQVIDIDTPEDWGRAERMFSETLLKCRAPQL
ncbi:pseudaminic acid cytidylyltransferase [Stappia sp. P2PMeth1]|uniref:pseudaminic acid cytidylyltransferase n=1 Tax=Stappia sp. P2PMeth1 TaxID=2003586 RepID=UPI0016486755|nr:pseudaminic acid cytidylyltransferase [Stappia sp. P2PMeth1]